MKQLLCAIIVFCTFELPAQSSPASHPYYLNEPGFEFLIPFSKTQLEIIKDLGIRRVEESWEPKSDTSSMIVHCFDSNGLLVSQYTYNIIDAQAQIIDSTVYTYDVEDRLILKKMEGLAFSSFDSIGYNSKSDVTYYDSFFEYNLQDTIEREVNFMLRPYEVQGDTVVLIDKFDEDYPTMYCFYKNVLTKMKDSYRTDSVEISGDEYGRMVKTYWVKDHRVLQFRVGMEKLYKDNLLQEIAVFDIERENFIGVNTNYYYREDGQLLRIEQRDKLTVLTYDDKELVTYKVERIMDRLFLTKYKYYYN